MKRAIITRTRAKEKGLKYYFTGKVCKNDHIAERRTYDCTCVECNKMWCNDAYKKNKETYNKNSTEYYEENREAILVHQKEKYAKDKQQLKYHYENHDKRLAYHKKWRRNNKGKVNANTALRKARLAQQTPLWAELDKIRWLYEKAQRLTELTGIPHHVDHIDPLTGETTSGLHCWDNLQILTQTENLQKYNKLLY